MGSTDSAFIRAFGKSHSARPTLRESDDSASTEVIVINAANHGYAAMTHIYAAAATGRPISVATAIADNIRIPAVPATRWYRHEFAHQLPMPIATRASTNRSKADHGRSRQITTRNGNLRIDPAEHPSPFASDRSEDRSDVAQEQLTEPHKDVVEIESVNAARNGNGLAAMTDEAVLAKAQAVARTIARVGERREESAASPQNNAASANASKVPNDDQHVAESKIPPGGKLETTAGLPKAVDVPPWLPEWEVDRFRWPKVCQSLSDQATSELADVVRPILNAAWRGKNVVAITSFDKNAGGTTVALSIARMAASFRVPVAVVDGDGEDSAMSLALGIAFDRGWSDVSGDCSLSDVAIASLHDRLVAVPNRPHETAAMANVAVADQIIEELAKNFELVVIDAGPIYSAAHHWFTPELCRRIHSTLIVRNLKETTARQVTDVSSRLHAAGMESIAVVENFAAANSPNISPDTATGH